jgi:hypothetical protein
MHVYEVRPREDHRGVDLISDALPFGRLGYEEVSDCEGQGHTGTYPGAVFYESARCPITASPHR